MTWQPVLFSSGGCEVEDEANHWGTPLDLYNAITAVWPCHIDIAAKASSAKCGIWVGPDQHEPSLRDIFQVSPERVLELARQGLADSYTDPEERPGAWKNPPYGRGMMRWLELARGLGRIMRVVVLIFARTDTAWWQDCVLGADGKGGARHVVYVRSRVTFIDPRTGGPRLNEKTGQVQRAPAPSAVLVYEPKSYHDDGLGSGIWTCGPDGSDLRKLYEMTPA